MYFIDSTSNNSPQQYKNNLAEGVRSASNCAMLPIQPRAAFLDDEHIKYEMFCKWLKLCESRQSLPTTDDVDIVNFQNDMQNDEQDNDTINKTPLIHHSSEEDDDEFLDTESNLEVWPTVPTIIEEYQSDFKFKDINVIDTNKCIFDVDNSDNNLDIDMKTVIPKLLNISPGSSSSDVTALSETSGDIAGRPLKIVTHKKGRAPPIPIINPLTEANITDDGALVLNNTVDKEPTIENKEKKKKNLFSYIPGIFKPISPSNSSANVSNTIKVDDVKNEHQHETLI